MTKHTYEIKVHNSALLCLQDGQPVEDWEILKGQRMSQHKLFVNGTGVATLDEVKISGIDIDCLIGGVKDGKGWTVYAVSTEKVVDKKTGEVTQTAKRLNGDVVITVMDKDGHRIEDKCKVIEG